MRPIGQDETAIGFLCFGCGIRLQINLVHGKSASVAWVTVFVPRPGGRAGGRQVACLGRSGPVGSR